MSIKAFIVPAALVILIVSACSSRSSETATPLATETTMSVMTNTPHPTVTATKFTETQTPTIEESIKIQDQCLEITDDVSLLQKDEGGKLIIDRDYASQELQKKLSSPYLYDVTSGKKTTLPGAYNFSVSLDQARVAYFSANDELVIADHNFEPVIQRQLDNYLLYGWGNDGLFLVQEQELSYLNLETGEIQSLDKNLPNLYSELNWKVWYPITLYDPSLSMAIYPTYDKSKGGWAIALWDVENKKEITHVSQGHGLPSFPMRPQWTQDGEKVILETNGESAWELNSISKNGTVDNLLIIPKDIGVIQFSVSPNNDYVAFWSPDPSGSMLENLRLYIFDIQKNQLTNSCIISPLLSGSPIWSPDSKQVAVELLLDSENSDIVIVNLEEQQAVKIGEDASPVGWLK
jgi:hypothetical protein